MRNRGKRLKFTLLISIVACLVLGATLGWGQDMEVPAYLPDVNNFEKSTSVSSRDTWHLGKNWTWDKTKGHGDTYSLMVEHANQKISRTWALTPAFDHFCDFIYPEYEFSAWIKTENVTGEGPELGFIALKPESGEEFFKTNLTGIHDWTKVTFRTKLPYNVWRGQIVLRFQGKGKVWVDDVGLLFMLPGRGDPLVGKEKVASLEGWRLKLDPDNVGIFQKWYRVDYDDSNWQPIEVTRGWENQGDVGAYDGLGWYRVKVSIPETVKNREVYLYFGAVDENAYVWVNGVYIGSHFGWREPFSLDITEAARVGGTNLVTVLVKDTAFQGGIYKPVDLMVEGKK